MLERLQLTDFRNYACADLTLCQGVNVVLGENGSGKTSLLEAIYFIGSGGRSFRGGRLSRLVRDDQPMATLFAEVTSGGQRHRLGLRRTPSSIDAVKLNGQTPRALSELAALLPVLALHPDSVELVFGPSSLRRRFLDWGMFHVEHSFLAQWRYASAALKQRNALLRAGRPDRRELDYWDQQLAASSDRIEGLRREHLKALQQHFAEVMALLAPELSVVVELHTGLRDGEDVLAALQRLRDDDIRRGFTQAGFHRADMRLLIEGHPARDYLSRGQAKLVAYGLVLSQLPMISTAGKVCTLLIDDLGAELDASHRAQVLRFLLTSGHQTVVTALDLAQWQEQCADNKEWVPGVEQRMFHVEHGRIRHLIES